MEKLRKSSSGKRFAVITEASSGIGYELAKQFAQNGFDLLVVANDSGITEAAQAFEAWGAAVAKLQINLANYDEVEILVNAILDVGRPLDAIAINIDFEGPRDFEKIHLSDELNLIHLNVVSTVHLIKRTLPSMMTNNSGKVLLTASVCTFMPTSFIPVYNATKAFLHSYSETLRHELKETNVTVTALMPDPKDIKHFQHTYIQDTCTAEHDQRTQAIDVAEQGFKALMSGQNQVIAGRVMTFDPRL